MRIKKYTARTEQEAIEKVKEELGLEALILNIKKTQPKGIFAFARKPLVEVTAAYTDQGTKEPPGRENEKAKESADKAAPPATDSKAAETVMKDKKLIQQQEKIKALESKLTNTEEMLETAVSRLSLKRYNLYDAGTRKYENNMIQLFHDTLLEQGVSCEIAEKILDIADSIDESDKIDINLIVKIVYNSIINILGSPEPVQPAKKQDTAKVIVFLGPTGVGKTTTIAKLSSLFILNHKLKVGLITADTYRIAAVEQLRTYAEILGIDVGVVYNSKELKDQLHQMNKLHDLILLDTAGRSHKNHENLNELKELLKSVPTSEHYLVLSTTTRCDDLLAIVETYSSITDFKIIFTKLDETGCLGSILNICYLTNKKMSYVTNGQNVPEDISVARPEIVARALLGLGSEVF